MRLSDLKHFDHILPLLQPSDVHHSIPLSNADVVRMHAHDDAEALAAGKNSGDVEEQIEAQGRRSGNALGQQPLVDSGEHRRSSAKSGEQTAEQGAASPRITRATSRRIADSGEQAHVQDLESAAPPKCLSLKEHKKLKHGRDVPPEAQLHYL